MDCALCKVSPSREDVATTRELSGLAITWLDPNATDVRRLWGRIQGLELGTMAAGFASIEPNSTSAWRKMPEPGPLDVAHSRYHPTRKNQLYGDAMMPRCRAPMPSKDTQAGALFSGERIVYILRDKRGRTYANKEASKPLRLNFMSKVDHSASLRNDKTTA
ncbi:hypothetical protein BDM02DRAFT_3129151 [Thelephora ganbajun]|uniref:Uncharacterized protein n=1 Tax=Thelephora ganbajun TaxID=370292 RepID=A0ACB6ZG11_THEGA|nr:hypothetical protein BDM02DRAFT_3129151 [Thelephora ganbajun]